MASYPKRSAEAGLLRDQPKITSPSSSSNSRISQGNRKLYESSAKTLGSFPRSVGPAADARELEYISSLHQNADQFLRKDGTISSKDIAPYLCSRYGMEITPEQAVDIAKNLCGGKLRSAFSAEKEAHDREMETSRRDVYEEVVEQKDEKEEEEEEEDVYYFDLVQVMSLLLIPELVEFAGKHNTEKEFLTAGGGVKSKLTMESDDIMRVVIDSLTEIFDEDVQQSLRLGGRVDKSIIQQILLAFGDVDSANDPVLLQQMLDALGGKNAALTTERFLKALTADVRPSFAEKKVTGDSVGHTSTFFDVFGWNWENPPGDDITKGGAPTPVKTASFIDYAADTYGSVLLNTAVWCLFILTTLIYVSFFRTFIQEETGGIICPPDDNFGCELGDKVISWILMALFYGLYGVFFIVPMSAGNVAGKTSMIFFTLMVTASFTYVPFGALLWYKSGMPHNEIIEYDYRTICPGPGILPDGTPAIIESAAEDLGAQLTLRLDYDCKQAVDWCQTHPETQGRYIDPDESRFTYKEFEKCANFFLDWVQYLGPWHQTGFECSGDQFCTSYGVCALADFHNETLEAKNYTCCHSMEALEDDVTGTFVCTNQAVDMPCFRDDLCESNICENGFCASNGKPGALGDPCESDHSQCQSGFCWDGTCIDHPTICPVNEFEMYDNVTFEEPVELVNYEAFGGYRLDPFCRTKRRWCETMTDLSLLEQSLNYFGVSLNATAAEACESALELLARFNLLEIKDETEAEIGDTYRYDNYDNIEEVLADNWTYFILISIGVVGFFALLAILKKIFSKNSDDRPREYNTKRAAEEKIGNALENALNMHPEDAKSKGQVMRNFFLHGEQLVEVGGLFWTVKKFLSGDLAMEEGLQYPGRIWVGQVVQIVVTIIGIMYAISSVDMFADELEERRKELGFEVTQGVAEGMSNYEFTRLGYEELRVTDAEQAQLDALPEKWMLQAAGYPAVAAGLGVAIFCILLYIPSVTNTILKLRNGMIPSLHDPFYQSYRKTPDNVVQNIGNMVFSLMGASVFMALIIGGVVFVFVYPFTREYIMGHVATAIGIICTMVIKIVGQKTLRKRNFSSFYRKKATSANYANLFFECWYLGSGLLVVVSRLVIFLISGALWLGRIDVEFLHPNVKVVGIGLDKVPDSFKRDILVHEAHKHPYIERLGGMYLRRLRGGEDFGTVAGTTWRSVFACGLMPWIVKYRVNTSDEAILIEERKVNPKYTRVQEC